MNSISGAAPARSSARARSATNTHAPLSSPTMTKSVGSVRAISAASASTRAVISVALNRTRNLPCVPLSRRDAGSVKPDAAVDVDGLAGDEAAVVADQKQAGGGDLDGSLAAERDARRIRHASMIPFGVVPSGVDAAGRDDVGADVLSGIFGGERPRHPDQPHLRRRDMHTSTAAAKGSVTGKEQDTAVVVL